jgi:hypothetical protein
LACLEQKKINIFYQLTKEKAKLIGLFIQLDHELNSFREIEELEVFEKLTKKLLKILKRKKHMDVYLSIVLPSTKLPSGALSRNFSAY